MLNKVICTIYKFDAVESSWATSLGPFFAATSPRIPFLGAVSARIPYLEAVFTLFPCQGAGSTRVPCLGAVLVGSYFGCSVIRGPFFLTECPLGPLFEFQIAHSVADEAINTKNPYFVCSVIYLTFGGVFL